MGSLRFAAKFLLLWTAGATVAFLVTIAGSDSGDAFDGLNNLLQLPFMLPAMPVALVLVGPSSPTDNWDLWTESLTLGVLSGPIALAVVISYRSAVGHWRR